MINKEEKQIKNQIKEFVKKYFVYQQTDPNIPESVKQELAKLGASKPFYAEAETERSIRLKALLNSEEAWIRGAIEVEIRKYFSVNNLTDTLALLAEIRTYQNNLTARMEKMKVARENKKYEWN